MIAALQLKYNRGRQASITNDLVDIITGQRALPFSLMCLSQFASLPRCQRVVITIVVVTRIYSFSILPLQTITSL